MREVVDVFVFKFWWVFFVIVLKVNDVNDFVFVGIRNCFDFLFFVRKENVLIL